MGNNDLGGDSLFFRERNELVGNARAVGNSNNGSVDSHDVEY